MKLESFDYYFKCTFQLKNLHQQKEDLFLFEVFQGHKGLKIALKNYKDRWICPNKLTKYCIFYLDKIKIEHIKKCKFVHIKLYHLNLLG